MKFLIFAFLILFQSLASENTFSESSLGEKISDKQLFGKYLREQITDSSEIPYRIIGQIGRGCTATLIGPKHVITAAHCVYDVRNAQWMMRLFFVPGQIFNGEYPFGRILAAKIYVQKEFIERADPEYDIAVVELTEAIGEKLGWAGIKVVDNNFTKTVRITGYPTDKILDTLWTVTCPVTLSGSQFHYLCDTYNGMSGSSLLSMNKNSELYIYGIHSGSTDQYNAGVMINQKNFDLIEGWKKNNLSNNTIVH